MASSLWVPRDTGSTWKWQRQGQGWQSRSCSVHAPVNTGSHRAGALAKQAQSWVPTPAQAGPLHRTQVLVECCHVSVSRLAVGRRGLHHPQEPGLEVLPKNVPPPPPRLPSRMSRQCQVHLKRDAQNCSIVSMYHIILYHIILYHVSCCIVSYVITSYRIISRRVIYHIVWYHIISFLLITSILQIKKLRPRGTKSLVNGYQECESQLGSGARELSRATGVWWRVNGGQGREDQNLPGE